LRWNPEISDIQTIISTAWNWHQIKQARRDGQGAAVGR
jgi:UDP-glucose 4-epimerase